MGFAPVSKMLIVGCGDIGERIGQRLLTDGHEVLGVVRTPASARRIEAAGIIPLCIDLDYSKPAPEDLAACEGVCYLVPPPREGEGEPRLQRLLTALPAQGLTRVIYISTTGVYGDCEGAWVDEDWPPRPQTPRARRRLEAEQTLTVWATARGVAAIILRVPGIYGPGRLPLERLRRGSPLVRPEQAPYSNRIHADDLAAICVAALYRGQAGAIYNCCDDQPTTMTDYFLRIADYAGLPHPPFIDLYEAETTLGPAMASFLMESRRLRNDRLKTHLGVRLQYPDLEAGLSALFARDEA